MRDITLEGRQIMIVEDEYLLADDLQEALVAAGAKVLGPAADAAAATALIHEADRIDAAILDIYLRDGNVFPVADLLVERGVPFLFATGYDEWAVPPRFATFSRVEKPLNGRKVAVALRALLG